MTIRDLQNDTRLAATTVVILLWNSVCISQISTKVASVSPSEAPSNNPVTVMAKLQESESIERVFLVFRPFGLSEWTRAEMDIVGNSATTTIAASTVLPPFIEYYLVLATRAGKLETYPLSETEDPFLNPPLRILQISIVAKDAIVQQVIFLSPEPDAVLPADEILISFSLLRADTLVVKRATQLFLDGANITAQVLISDDIFVVPPENISSRLTPGRHKLTVWLFNREGNIYRNESIFFTVAGRRVETAPGTPLFKYNATVNLESRREEVSQNSTWYNRGGLQFNGTSGIWRFTANTFVTSDERSDRQPQNRFFAGVESPWGKVGYGDSYPTFPSLIMSGKRVRGLNASLRTDVVNLDLAMGTTNRGIDGRLLKIIPQATLDTEQQSDPGASYAQIDDSTWGKFSFGTYERDLFVIRPSFGSGDEWQIGFTWLKSKDDVGSIRHGIRPQENLVVGTDFVSRFDERRIEFSGQAAFSAFNSDISSGTFSDAYIDSVYRRDAQAIKDARDLLKGLITVNDNLRPLSLKRLSTVAYDLGLALTYFNNALRFIYLFRGSDYNSFGQTFLRTDIRGFNLQDRIRFSNRVFVLLGYERLKDNTSRTKPSTTTYTTLNAAVNYFSLGVYPNVTVGYSRYSNTNGLPARGPDSSIVVDDETNRFYLQLSQSFALGAAHNAALSFSTSKRSDRSIRKLDVNSTVVSVTLNTQYEIPLTTTLEYSLNLNRFPSSATPGGSVTLDYSIVSLIGRYQLVRNVLTLNAGFSPSFGDFNRNAFDVGGQWTITPSMSLVLQFSLFHNKNAANDDFWSLRYRYTL